MRELLPLAEKVGALLKARKETISIAESSTGGLVSAALLAQPGASAYYVGGAVNYTRVVLLHLSGMRKEELEKMRGATEEFAMLAARSVKSRYGTHWGLGEGGAAGPTGNRYGDPAGHVCLAVTGPAVTGPMERSTTLRTGSADRVTNMYSFAAAALDLLAKALESKG
jgi:PncC family amidohydrolase